MCNTKSLYNLIVALGNFLRPFFLLLIRILWGLGFFWAGYAKFSHMDKVIELLTQLGIHWPHFSAYLLATVELVGGLMLVFGFGARLAAIPLAIAMFVAFATAHLPALKDLVYGYPASFEEFSTQAPIGFLLTALTILCFGPGLFSVDGVLKRFCCDQCSTKK